MLQTGRLMALLMTGTVLTGTVASAADPNLLNLVMPDAKILAGVNATSARISPFGQFILSKISGIGQSREFSQLGFNPLQDVSEILAASAADPSNPGGLVLATGSFPVDKITAALAGRTNPQVQSYGGATLIVDSSADNKVVHAVAFLGQTIAIAGDLASVKAAVDRQTNPTSIDSSLAVKVNQLSGSQDEWVVSIAPVASLTPANATQTNTTKGPAAQVLPILKSIQSFDGGVKLTDTIAVTGEAITTDPNNAAALQAVIKLGLTLASSANTANDPHFAELLQLLQSLQVTVNGAAVDLALSIPESQLEAFVNSLPTRPKAAVSPAVRHRDGNGEVHKRAAQ